MSVNGYEYVRHMYGVNPIPGQRVRLEGAERREGVIAQRRGRASHYVHVRFDGQRYVRPCHPTSLTYLGTAAGKWGGRRPSPVQIAILKNILADRPYDFGRPHTRSDAAGWGSSHGSCVRRGWLRISRDRLANRPVEVTEAGMAVLELWSAT